MKPSKRMEYAIHAVALLGKRSANESMSCKEIAKAGDMPHRFLLQILGQLTQYGILSSTRGVDGGYRLIQTLDEITLYDVLKAIGEADGGSTKAAKGTSRRVDASHDTTDHIHRGLRTLLEQVTLRQFFGE